MDSLTQITLGAAVGEVILGKKLGNRAMIWGAVAGTIPDLDVVANLVTDDISALAFHRAITHSLTFSVLAAPVLGWLLHRMDQQEGHFLKSPRLADSAKAATALFLIIGLGALPMPIPAFEVLKISAAVTLAIMGFPLLSSYRQSLNGNSTEPEAQPGFRLWTWFFFWSIVTHPLLDACTTYGTQLFQPFSDYRAALNNISVVDPLYTIPFLLLVIIASRFTRTTRARRVFNWAGILLSSTYLIITFFHKTKVNSVFEQSLSTENIAHSRYLTSPTIFNNILWQGLGESENHYHYGMYSLLDARPAVDSFVQIPKNHAWIAQWKDERPIKILAWFSDGYYNILQREDGRLQFNDLRFGSLTGKFDNERALVFGFILEEKAGKLSVSSSQERPPEAGDSFRRLWLRMMGKL
jgi:inner membrane protein